VSKRLKSTLLSYWKSQNLNQKFSKSARRQALDTVRETKISAVQLSADCELSALDYILQGADTQGFRRLSISTVRKSLKVKKIFKIKQNPTWFVTQKVSQGILRTQKFTNQKKKATRANGHRKFKKPKRQRDYPQWSRQFCLWINP
jgi:hypothetical protein